MQFVSTAFAYPFVSVFSSKLFQPAVKPSLSVRPNPHTTTSSRANTSRRTLSINMADLNSIKYDDSCLFCKISKGEIPSYKVYEDEHCLAFLDLFPAAKGHTLLIPKTHCPGVDQMDAEVAGRVLSKLPMISKAVKKAAGVDSFNVVQNNGSAAGQVVFHAHFHIIPRSQNDGLPGFKSGAKLEPEVAAPIIEAFKTSL